ncbi:hypothetical protein LTR97_001582 [Elasticomyces elasticus]|uniref:Uncharacterized protein n=1 Tax=Elasticomyces elasticus TaxID=574655 RepID=A0AAN7WCJ9_9PEZI|nr:hypothetical protein LTR97_001582 [Elasticomyces elasticus]
MYRSVLRTQSWTTSSGYKQNAASQARHESTQTHTAASTGGGGDDDFFNSISEEYASPGKDTRLTRPERAKKRATNIPVEAEARQAAQDVPTDVAAKMGQGIHSLQSELAQRLQNGKAIQVAKPATAFKRQGDAPRRRLPSRLPSDPAARQQRIKDYLAAKGIEWDDSKYGPNKAKAVVLSANSHPEVADAKRKEQADFEDVMAALEGKPVSQKQHPSLKSLIEDLNLQTSRPTAADDIEVPEGITQMQGSTPEPEVRQRIEMPAFSASRRATSIQAAKTSPAAEVTVTVKVGDESAVTLENITKSTPIERQYSFARRPQSIAAKQRETNSKPGWGDTTLASTKTASASFDSLRAADRVSAVPRVRTAGERKAWAGEPVIRTFASDSTLPLLSRTPFGNLDDAEAGVGQKQAKRNDLVSAPMSFESLKQKLDRRTGKAVESARLKEAEENTPDQAAIHTSEPNDEPIVGSALKTSSVGDQNNAVEAEDNAGSNRSEGDRSSGDRLFTITRPRHERRIGMRAARTAAFAKASQAVEAVEVEEVEEVEDLPSDDSFLRLAKLHDREEAQPQAESGDHKSLAEVMAGQPVTAEVANQEEVPLSEPEPYQTDVETSDIRTLTARDLKITALNIPDQPAVPPLQYGLDRVLFNPGVYQLQDPLSRTYNFDPYLQKIMPIAKFDFNALKEYKTSSQDGYLGQLANEHGKKFVGSTSSMTGTLAHFHYLLSNWRPINLEMLSRGFKDTMDTFTQINRAPNAIFLRYKPESQTYAIDADKEFDSANVLMMLGKSMEKLLTLPKDHFERYRRDNTDDPITAVEKEEPEAFEYTAMGDFLMRSQLDAHDSRLPGTGMFDLKTRAVLSIRMDTEQYEKMLGYELFTLQGTWESYEREYYDMLRSTMLKYMLQARMGRMDGIFLAYHNIQRLFGFQYLSMMEIDRAMHGQVDASLGDQEFKVSIKMLNEVLEMATQEYPGRSLRIHFEAASAPASMMWVFAEPMDDGEIDAIQGKAKKSIAAFEADVMGIEKKDAEAKVEDGEKQTPDADAEFVDEAEQAIVRAAESSADGTSTTSAPDAPLAEDISAEGSKDYTNTSTPLDPHFATSISSRVEDNLRPLFAATLIMQNFVNGAPCTDNRPTNLTKSDEWEVQYILKQAPLTMTEKWARYEGAKARRKKIFEKVRKEEVKEGEEVVKASQGKNNGYFTMLKEMVERGRTFRKAMERFEGEPGRVAKRVGAAEEVPKQAMPAPVATPVVEEEQKIESVDGYMKWLYRK